MKAIFATTLALAASFAAAQGFGQYHNQFDPPVRWSNLIQGENSAILRPEAVVLSSQNDWEIYWKRMNGVPLANFYQAPRVCDFMFEDLVIIHAGVRPTGGFGVYVELVNRPSPHQWVVNWVLLAPPANAHVIRQQTSPYTIIRVQRTVGVPYFQGRTVVYQTYQGGHWGCNNGNPPPVYMVGKGGALIPYNPPKPGKDKRN